MTASEPFPKELAFPKSEYDGRVARVRAAMERAGLDLLLVHSLPNICYLTGAQTPLADWYHCLIVTRAGELILQLCDTELARVNSEIARIEGVLWEHMEAAGGQLVALLEELGVARRSVGLELSRPGLSPQLHATLTAALPQTRFVDASDLVARIRAVKSPAEVACLREAARYTVAGMEAAIAALRPGASENSLTAAGAGAMFEAGSEYFSIDPIVRAGARSSVIHATCKRTPIAAGDAVFMEFGGVHQRYTAPLIRTAVLGPPPERMRRLADASLATLRILHDNLRPGRSLHDVAAATSREAPPFEEGVRTRGYYGYCVGIGFPPVWVEHSLGIVEGEHALIEPGMVFHSHRSLRIAGQLTVAFSETILVTGTGCEPLTRHPRALAVR